MATNENQMVRTPIGQAQDGAEIRAEQDASAFSPNADMVRGNIAVQANRAIQTQETKETPMELTALIEKMKATAEKHKHFGFGSDETLTAFLNTLPQKLSQDSLATIKALKPRETAESYIVFFKDGNEIFMGESAPSSKGADGKEGNGVNIAATEAGKTLGLDNNWFYSETGSADELLAQLTKNGAIGLTRASKASLRTLQRLQLFSNSVLSEWLSDPTAPGRTWYGLAEWGYSLEYVANYAHEIWGVRTLRNVTSEFDA